MEGSGEILESLTVLQSCNGYTPDYVSTLRRESSGTWSGLRHLQVARYKEKATTNECL